MEQQPVQPLEPQTSRSRKSRAARIAACILAAFIIAFCVISFAFDRYVLGQTYARFERSTPNVLPTYDVYAQDYPRADYTFQMNGYTLVGHVYGPDNNRGLIVFRHGIFSQHQDYLALITAIVDSGWRVFAYDAIGCGESDGDSTLGMSQSPLDVAAAVNFVREAGLVSADEPLVLWGHSWGGYGVAAALGLVDDIDGCITMSGFDTPMKILTYSATNTMGPLGMTQVPFLWLNTVIDFGDKANLSASDAIVNAGVPTLIIHGSGDTVVPYDGVSIQDGVNAHLWSLPGKAIGIVTYAEPGRNGHNDYFYSRESQEYLNECAVELQELLAANDGDKNAPAVQDYLASVDMRRANTANPALVEEITTFLNVCCPEEA